MESTAPEKDRCRKKLGKAECYEQGRSPARPRAPGLGRNILSHPRDRAFMLGGNRGGGYARVVADTPELSIIPRPESQLAVSGHSRIVGGMVEDALALGREEAVVQSARFRIGDYMWCEPDYRQILVWAEALKMEPLTVIERLLDDGTFWGTHDPTYSPERALTRFKDGRIETLRWDRRLLPIKKFRWVEGLQITSLHFSPVNQPESSVPTLPLPLPQLDLLSCRRLGLTALDLSHVHNLTGLSCDDNRIIELDLSHVPNLTWLSCGGNELTKLDLSHVPNLTGLSCGDNKLTKLDLSHVPNLTYLSCDGNELTKLDLSHVPNLTYLSCGGNELTKLDLSNTPELNVVCCGFNRLSELDLSRFLNLTNLECDLNQLCELDLSYVPNLTKLRCSRNRITELDLSCVSNLTRLYCQQNQLAALNLSNVPNLISLACSENQFTELDIRPLLFLDELGYDAGSTRLIQRPNQTF